MSTSTQVRAVNATSDERSLLIAVVDDGVGGADEEGEGLRGLADRVEAVGGRLTLESPAGGGTRLRAEIPHGCPEAAPGGESAVGAKIPRFVI